MIALAFVIKENEENESLTLKLCYLVGKEQCETRLQWVSGQKTEEISSGPRSPCFQLLPKQINNIEKLLVVYRFTFVLIPPGKSKKRERTTKKSWGGGGGR